MSLDGFSNDMQELALRVISTIYGLATWVYMIKKAGMYHITPFILHSMFSYAILHICYLSSLLLYYPQLFF